MKSVYYVVISLLFGPLLLAGCGAKEASIETKGIEVDSVPEITAKGYQDGRLRLGKITMFLWKKEMSGATVSQVNQISQKLNLEEDKRADLDKRMIPIDQAKQKRLDLRRQRTEVKKTLSKKEKDFLSVQEAYAKTPTPELKDMLDQLSQDSEIQNSTKLHDIANIDSAILKLDSEIGPKEEALKAERDAITARVADYLQQMMELTDWFEAQPKEFGVNFAEQRLPDGSIQTQLSVFLRDWDPNDGGGKRTFTSFGEKDGVEGFAADDVTDWNAIKNVKYSPTAGKIQFTIQTQDGYSYRVELVRSEIKKSPGQINFSGDITRSKAGEDERYGILKLSNKS